MIHRIFVALFLLATASAVQAADWIHWRGPDQTGRSRDKGIPGEFGIKEPGKNNLLWKSEIGGRSTPLVMNGKLYVITEAGPGAGVMEGERVVCMNADTGAKEWETVFGVFHTDTVSSRLGWTTLTADPASGSVFCHGSQGYITCFDAKTGAIKWERSLTEEFGRVSGYGGRISSPIFDSGLVIIGVISSSWGNQARGANRFYAFDSATGKTIWIAELPGAISGTYYSNPVIAVINGQRLLISGGAEGGVHAFKVRTGEIVWNYPFSKGVVNPSPIVEGNKVYISHGEENPEGGPIGRVICLDAAQIDEKTKRPKLLWEVKNLSKRFGLASGALADGVYYVPDDSAELVAFDAANGSVLWKHKYGTVSRGAPLVVDGKLFVFDVFGVMTVLELKGKRKPNVLSEINFKPKSGVGVQETHGTPICVNGRLYFCTRENTFCITDLAGKAVPGTYAPLAEEKPLGEAAALRIEPADVAVSAGQSVPFTVKFLDANGREVKAPVDAKVEWSLPAPPLPPGATTGPPPLKGTIAAEGLNATVALEKIPAQQGFLLAKAGTLAAPIARVRVAPSIPYANDFEKTPVGAPPAGWVNATGKYVVKDFNGNKVLSKINNDSRPPIARANAYITPFTSKDYVIECDVMGTEVRGRMPDLGIVNSRYNLILDGKPDSVLGNSRTLRIIAWEALPRINVGVAFDWKPGEWYRLKLALEPGEKSTKILGKVWKKGETEPVKWTIEYDDPNPYKNGSAALYGYVTNMKEPDATHKETLPGSEIFYDNLLITPAKK